MKKLMFAVLVGMILSVVSCKPNQTTTTHNTIDSVQTDSVDSVI